MWRILHTEYEVWHNENYSDLGGGLGKWFLSDLAQIDLFRFYHWYSIDNLVFNNGMLCFYHHLHVKSVLLTLIQDLECKSISKLWKDYTMNPIYHVIYYFQNVNALLYVPSLPLWTSLVNCNKISEWNSMCEIPGRLTGTHGGYSVYLYEGYIYIYIFLLVYFIYIHLT